MKKVLLTLVVLILVVACIGAFVGCKPPEVAKKSLKNWGNDAPTKEVIGDSVVAINDQMSGAEMMQVANENYSNCNYVAAYQQGVVTTSMGIKVQQAVDGLRIRNNGEYFMFNNSNTVDAAGLPIDIRIMEQYHVDAQNKFMTRTAAKKDVDVVNKKLKANKWTPRNFTSKKDYLKVNKNDPTRINMYIIDESTIKSTTDPVKKVDEKTGVSYYEFSVTCIGKDAFKEYVPVMKQMLDMNVSGAVIKPDGMGLKYTKVQIWENGVFKMYNVSETYDIKVGPLNGGVVLNSTVKFNYDPTEEPFEKHFKDGKFMLNA